MSIIQLNKFQKMLKYLIMDYIHIGIFDFIGIIGQSISALVLGIVCCKLLKNGKNIWNPIIAHSIYDLMYVLLVGGV